MEKERIYQFQRAQGTAKHAPYLITKGYGQEFLGRIDTGADISIVPRAIWIQGEPVDKSVVIAKSDGTEGCYSVRRVKLKTDFGEIVLDVLPTANTDRGLLGIDFLSKYELTISVSGGMFILSEE